jgi:hypothetical protein
MTGMVKYQYLQWMLSLLFDNIFDNAKRRIRENRANGNKSKLNLYRR